MSGIYFGRANDVHNIGWKDIWSASFGMDYTDSGRACNGMMFRNSPIRYRDVTNGLSNTMGERSENTWKSDRVFCRF